MGWQLAERDIAGKKSCQCGPRRGEALSVQRAGDANFFYPTDCFICLHSLQVWNLMLCSCFIGIRCCKMTYSEPCATFPLINWVVTADLSPSLFLPHERRKDMGFYVFYKNKQAKEKKKNSLKRHQISHPHQCFILECPECSGNTPCLDFSVLLPYVHSALSASGANINIYCAAPRVHIHHWNTLPFMRG